MDDDSASFCALFFVHLIGNNLYIIFAHKQIIWVENLRCWKTSYSINNSINSNNSVNKTAKQ